MKEKGCQSVETHLTFQEPPVIHVDTCCAQPDNTHRIIITKREKRAPSLQMSITNLQLALQDRTNKIDPKASNHVHSHTDSINPYADFAAK